MLWLLTAPRYQYLTPVSYHQWRRSVEKSGGQGQSGQAIKLFQITTYVSDFQTLNNPGCWQPVGALKNWFYLPFLTQVFHRWWCDTCRVSQQQFWMKECDILRGSKHTLPLRDIFWGSGPPIPSRIDAPGSASFRRCWKVTATMSVGCTVSAVLNCRAETLTVTRPAACDYCPVKVLLVSSLWT